MWWTDWKQFKKNLEEERQAWDLYETKRDMLLEEAKEAIARKKLEIDLKKAKLDKEFEQFRIKVEASTKRKLKWVAREYQNRVWKKTKSSVSLWPMEQKKQ